MPIPESLRINYENGLRSFIANPESGFADLPSSEYGLGINALNSVFAKQNNISDTDLEELAPISGRVLQEFKNEAEIPRFIPKQEDFPLYYEQFPTLPDTMPIEQRIQAIDNWKSASAAKAKSMRPGDSEDFDVHLNSIANNFITAEVAKDNKTSWAGDKVYRAIEGFARMGTAFSPDVEWADRFLAENLPEDPSRNEDFSSLLAAGVGELASQALYSLVVGATTGPQNIPLALGALYSAKAMKEGYDEQFKKSGDTTLAMNAAVASIPGALLETAADAILFKGGTALHKTFQKRFLEATTEVEKRAVLQEAIPKLGKEILKNGFNEATVGAIGADFTTGMGRYIATGDESYIPKMDDLLKGAAVEGILGAGYTAVSGGGVNAAIKDVSAEMFTSQAGPIQAKQSDIFNAIKQKDLDKAIGLASGSVQGSVSSVTTPEAEVEATSEANKNTSETNEESPAPTRSAATPNFGQMLIITKQAQEMRAAGNEQEAVRLERAAAAIKSGTYVPPEQYTAPANIANSPAIAFTNPEVMERDVVLEDGTTLEKNENIVFISNLNAKELNTNNELNGGISLGIELSPDPNVDISKGYFIAGKNGKKVDHRGQIRVSLKPRKGFIPVKVGSFHQIGTTLIASNTFQPINSKVVSYNKAVAQKEAPANKDTSAEQTTPEAIESDTESPDIGAFGTNVRMRFTPVRQNLDLFQQDFERQNQQEEAQEVQQPVQEVTQPIQETVETPQNEERQTNQERPTQEAPQEVQAEVSVLGFTTSKGSNYIINADGTTTRDKAERVEHPGEKGIQPKSTRTIYVDEIGMDALGIVQTQGVKFTLEERTDGTFGARAIDGPNKGKFYGTSITKFSNVPAIGMIPVELWNQNDGQSVHFGNKIISIQEAVNTIQESPESVVTTVSDNNITVESTVSTDSNPEIGLLESMTAALDWQVKKLDTLPAGSMERQATEEKVRYLQESVAALGGEVSVPQAFANNTITPEVKEQLVYNEAKEETFLDALNNFISTLSAKGRAVWTSKLNDTIAYYESGGKERGSLSPSQAKIAWGIIENFDAKLASQVTEAEQRVRDATKNEKEFTARKALQDKEKQEIEKGLEKTRYAIANPIQFSEPTISLFDAASYIAKNNLPVKIVNTYAVSEHGHQWSGKTNFYKNKDAEITVNIANIRNEAELRNVINEELGHVVYNNPNLKSIIDKIISSTPDNNALRSTYPTDQIAEESAVKRLAELVDQYNEKGAFEKLITAIKVYVKDTFGMELSDSDLQFVAYRAINRALKDPNLLKVRSPENVEMFDRYNQVSNDIEIVESDILSQIRGVTSPRVAEIRKRLNKIIKAKLESKLPVNEPQIWSSIKHLNFQFLNEEDLDIFKGLVDEFVNTRRKRNEPLETNVRANQEFLMEEMARLNKAAAQGKFDWYQQDNEFLQDKDFERDYNSDLDKVKQAVDDYTGTNDSDVVVNNMEEDPYDYRILELREYAAEDAKNRLDEAFSEVLPTSSNNERVNKHLSKYTEVAKNHVASERKRAEQAINSLVNTDPQTLSPKKKRQQYYALMSLMSDGYLLNASNFISEEMQAVLNTSLTDTDLINPHVRKGWRRDFAQSTSSFATNVRRMGNKAADLMFKIATPFRRGIENAEQIQDQFVRPALTEMQRQAEKESGKKYGPADLNNIGMYVLGKNYLATETPAQGLIKSLNYIRRSVEKSLKSFDKKFAAAAQEQLNVITRLQEGITPESKDALEIYERNAAQILDKGMLQYGNDVIALGETFTGMARFTTEFVYGRPFNEWVNYISAFQIESGDTVHVDLNPMQASANDQQLAGPNLADNTNMMTAGMSSTKERTRQISPSKLLVLNINAMAEGRMRINTLDYMTASARRELNNVISSKGSAFAQFTGLLNDSDGSKGRVSHLQHTFRTMWNNAIQSASFVSDFQGIANGLTNLWASVKLSSFYQLPAQWASNMMPYFVANATNPRKISMLFEASNILIKYRAGKITDPRLNKVIERINYAIESRQQDVFLDKTVALDVDGKGMWNMFRNTKLGMDIIQGARSINDVRQRVLFWQFKKSDEWSGAPMMLAEYMDAEQKAGRAVDWDGLSFNDESYFKALDETERFIGVGGNSRRGVWLNGKNGWMTLARNMLSAFSSHRINNATNFRGEWIKMTNGNLNFDERMQSAQYMMGIMAQSALFTVIKAHMIGMFYNLVTAKMGEEENEEELEAYYEQLLTGNYRKEDRQIIEAEISLREKVRNEFNRVKEASTNSEVIMMNTLKDSISNAFILPAISEVPLNAILHFTYDKSEADAFKLTKAATIEQYEQQLKEAKANNNISEAIELQKNISRWESQEAIQLVYEQRGIIPFDGAYGGVLKDAAKVLEKGAGVMMGAESISLADVFMTAGIFGLGQADANKIIRLYTKREEYEQEMQEKLEAIEAKRLKKQNQ